MISKHGSITKGIFFNHGRGKKDCVEKEEENPYNKKKIIIVSRNYLQNIQGFFLLMACFTSRLHILKDIEKSFRCST